MLKIIFLLIILLTQNIYAEQWLNLQKRNGLVDNYVKKVLVYNDELWVGTPSGVSVYHLITKKWRSYHKGNVLPDNFVNDIFIDDEYVLVATVNGVARYNKKNKKWDTLTKKNGLGDNYVTSIYADKGHYWFGTKYWGVSVYSKRTRSFNIFTAIDGLADNRVNTINGMGDEIWFGTQEGISQLKYYAFLWKVYTSKNTDFGLARDSVISLLIDRDDIWCGTEGEGISLFDKFSEKWSQFNTGNKLLDDFILSMAKDGENIWIGTFGGVSLYNKFKRSWENFGERKELPESSINSIAVEGDYIWLGTAGGGVTRYKKDKPQIEINYIHSGYTGKNLIKMYGTIFDHDGISKINITYRKRNETSWDDKGIKLLKERNVRNDYFASWDTSDLQDGEYIIKIDAFDEKGHYNSAETIFTIDTIKPVLYLDEYKKFINASSVNISGTYFEDNLVDIILEPKERTVSIDKMFKTYTVPVSLKNGENRFTLKALDMAGQTTSLDFNIIKDDKKPVIRILNREKTVSDRYFRLQGEFDEEYLDFLYFKPFNEYADIDYKNRKFSKLLVLKEGRNMITCLARDKAGNQTSVEKIVSYVPKRDPVDLVNFSPIYNKKKIRLSGKALSRNVSAIKAELNKNEIPVEFDKNNLQFKMDLDLREGKNYLSLNIILQDQKNYIMIKEIICDTQPPELKLTHCPVLTRENKIEIEGKYTEMNFGKLSIKTDPPSRVEIDIDEAVNEFTALVPLSQKQNRLEFLIMDSAGNQAVYRTNIMKDNTPPQFLSLDFPRFTNQNRIKVKGFFHEDHILKVEVENGDIIQMGKDNFLASVSLDENENDIEITLYDRLGFERSTNITVFLDDEKPEILLDPVPDLVKQSILKLSGRMESDDIISITADGETTLSKEQERFHGTIKLQPGENTVEVTACDRAGNVTRISRSVYYDSPLAKENMIMISKEEYNRIKTGKVVVEKAREEIKEGRQFQRSKLSDNPSLVLTPYFVSQGDSLWKLSRDYYGTPLYADYILKLNELIDPVRIKQEEKIYIPTLKLIHHVAHNDNDIFFRILSFIVQMRYNHGYYKDIRRYNKYFRSFFSNYGLDHRKLFSNYNKCLYLIDQNNLLIFSRFSPNVAGLKNLTKNLDLDKLNIIFLQNNRDEIVCNFYDNYKIK
ncbi:MAG: Ig-like domain repeat protein [Spirochaetes bacterium]|nr:Ig-like domain repeat protein [Spirochaetota bacterium]